MRRRGTYLTFTNPCRSAAGTTQRVVRRRRPYLPHAPRLRARWFTAGPRRAILACFLANYWLYQHDRTSLPDELWCLILGFLRGLDLNFK